MATTYINDVDQRIIYLLAVTKVSHFYAVKDEKLTSD
jgi:hypothetical protein